LVGVLIKTESCQQQRFGKALFAQILVMGLLNIFTVKIKFINLIDYGA
jgi:hypothetical protein